MSLKKLMNTLHLWLGITSGIILLIVATTGCMLVFEDDVRSAPIASALIPLSVW